MVIAQLFNFFFKLQIPVWTGFEKEVALNYSAIWKTWARDLNSSAGEKNPEFMKLLE